MVPRPFFTRDLKVARAYEHIEDVKQLAQNWLGTDAYTVAREIDPETGHTVCKARIKGQPPVEIGLVVGDAVHNLRSALDHAVYALAERHLGPLPIEDQERLAFPIVGNQNSKGQPADGSVIFQELLTGRRRLVELLPDNVLRYIESIQPYRWEGEGFRHHWLWFVHDLDRIDKHRRIHVASAWLGMPYVTSPGDPTAIEIQWSHVGNTPVNDGDVLLAFSGAEEGVDAHFARGVAIGEGSAQGQEVGALLDLLAGKVEVYVATMLGEIATLVWP